MEEEKKVTEEQAQETPVDTQEQQPAEQPKRSIGMFAEAMDAAIEKGRRARERNIAQRSEEMKHYFDEPDRHRKKVLELLSSYSRVTGEEHPLAKKLMELPPDKLPWDINMKLYRDYADALAGELRKIDQWQAVDMEKNEAKQYEGKYDSRYPTNANPHKRQGFEE